MPTVTDRAAGNPILTDPAAAAAARSWKEVVIAAVLSAAAVSALLYLPDRDDGSGSVLGGLTALVGVALGLAAASRLRPLPRRAAVEHLRLAPRALGLGVAVGVANLAVNFGMATLDPAIYEQMVTRWAEFSAWSMLVGGVVMEEIAYRLFLMSVLAWIVARFTDDRSTIFYVALGVSALLFGVAHIFYGGVGSAMYKVGMAAKTTAGGLVFGWVFWRWGLPYSILCHSAANAAHLLLMPLLFRFPGAS